MLSILFLFLPLFAIASPELLIFSGPPQCAWTESFQKEILSKYEFTSRLEKEIAIKYIDFSNEEARKKYQIEIFPTLILIKDKETTEIPFKPLPPAEYATFILEILEFQKQMENLNENSDLKKLYLTAERLSLPPDQVIELGCKVEKDSYFHLEKYAQLLKGKKLKESQELKKRIISRDAKNRNGTLYSLALVEFEVKKQCKKAKAIRPMLKYLDHFGEKDKEYAWKAELVIAEYLYNIDNQDLAMKHVQKALKIAPEDQKEQIKILCSSLSP